MGFQQNQLCTMGVIDVKKCFLVYTESAADEEDTFLLSSIYWIASFDLFDHLVCAGQRQMGDENNSTSFVLSPYEIEKKKCPHLKIFNVIETLLSMAFFDFSALSVCWVKSVCYVFRCMDKAERLSRGFGIDALQDSFYLKNWKDSHVKLYIWSV